MADKFDHIVDFVKSLQGVQDVLLQGLRTAALIAVATLIAVQLLKAPVRFVFHWLITAQWLAWRVSKVKQFRKEKLQRPDWLTAVLPDELKSAEKEAERKSVQKEAPTAPAQDFRLPEIIGWMPFVPTAHYLKKVQNVAERALEHPAQEEVNFAYFAADATVRDMVVTYQVDVIAQRDPKFLERLTVREDAASPPTPDSSAAAAVALAQDNVSTSIERSLDDLQIRLVFWWPIVMRFSAFYLALLIGMAIRSAVSQDALLPADLLTMVVICVAAGYLASFVYDLMSLLAAFRPRTQ